MQSVLQAEWTMGNAADGVAKVFWSGRSQAVRLPKAFRLEGSEVRVRRQGQALVLEPIHSNWEWLQHFPAPVDDDFERHALQELEAQERPELNDLRLK